MTAPGALETTLRAIVRDVVREEVRAAIADLSVSAPRRNGEQAEGYLSIAKAAAYADVAAGTLRRWIRSGRLPARRAGRVHRIARAELDGFLAREGRSAEVGAKARAILGRRG